MDNNKKSNFDKIDEKIQKVEEYVETISNKIDKIDEKIQKVEEYVETISTKINTFIAFYNSTHTNKFLLLHNI